MSDSHAPSLGDSERTWILVFLLGCLWLGPAFPYHLWVVATVTAALTVLCFAPFGKRWLRGTLSFTATAAALSLLVAVQVVNTFVQAFARGWAELGIEITELATSPWSWVLGVVAIVAMFVVGGGLLLVRPIPRRFAIPGPAPRPMAAGLLLPLVFCLPVAVWARKAGSAEFVLPVRATATLVFLFYVYTHWPNRFWLSRWVLLGACLLAPAAQSDWENFIGSASEPDLPLLGAVCATVGGFFWILWDFARAVFLLDDPGVRAFFFGGPLTPPTDWSAVEGHDLLNGLNVFETGGASLSPVLALVLPTLLALRLVRGEPRKRATAYAVAWIVLCIATIPLVNPLVDVNVYWPIFLRRLRLLWLTQVFPLQAVVAVAPVISLPLAQALSGRTKPADTAQPTTDKASVGPDALPVPIVPDWLRRLPRKLLNERILLPPLLAVVTIAGLVGAICTLATAHFLGTFHGTIDPRPGETAQGPILGPLFTKHLSPLIEWSERSRQRRQPPKPGEFNLEDYPLYAPDRDVLMSGQLLPDAAACERLTSEGLRPEIRPFIEAFERAAEADVCGWRVINERDGCGIPAYINVRGVARFISSRANVAMAQGRWDDAREDIRRLIRFAMVFGSEGTLVQRMIGVAVCDGGKRCAFGALRLAPDAEVRPLFEQLRDLHPWVRRLVDGKASESAEPALKWPDRFVFPTMMLVGTWRASVVDLCNVAEFRLLLLAAAIRCHLIEQGRLPASLRDLTPLFEGPPPLDPFSGEDFVTTFTARRVRLSTAPGSLPTWFDATARVFYIPGTQQLHLTIDADGQVAIPPPFSE